MLNRKGRPQRKRVKALTDPKPEFVSLVNAGANKTPFRALRAESVEQDPQDLRTDHEEEVSEKSEAFAVARIEFDGETFNDQAAVAEWLHAGGYEDAKVEKTDKGFTVTGDIPQDADLIEITGQGFTMYVAEVNPGATALKSDSRTELRKKFDEDVASGDAPLLLNMTMGLYESVSLALRSGDADAARAAITEYSSLFDEMMEQAPGSDEPTMKAFLDAVAPEVEMTKETTEAVENAEQELDVSNEEEAQKANESTGPSGEAADAKLVSGPDADGAIVAGDEVDNTPEGNAASGPEPTGDAAADKMTSTPDSANAVTKDSTDEEVAERVKEDGQDSEGEAAAKSDEGDPLAALTALVGDLTKSVKELGETMATKTDELAQRVAAVEDVRQTRKGADVDEATTSKKSESITDEMAELRKRSMMGLR